MSEINQALDLIYEGCRRLAVISERMIVEETNKENAKEEESAVDQEVKDEKLEKEVGSGVLCEGEAEALEEQLDVQKEESEVQEESVNEEGAKALKEEGEVSSSELEDAKESNDEDFEPIDVRKLKKEMQEKREREKQDQDKSCVDKEMEPASILPSYRPLLARQTNLGDYGIIFKGQLYVLHKNSYQVMRTSINQRKEFCEIKAVFCYKCHQNHEEVKTECITHPIPTCLGCGRLLKEETNCPTPIFRYLKNYGELPGITLTCPYYPQ